MSIFFFFKFYCTCYCCQMILSLSGGRCTACLIYYYFLDFFFLSIVFRSFQQFRIFITASRCSFFLILCKKTPFLLKQKTVFFKGGGGSRLRKHFSWCQDTGSYSRPVIHKIPLSQRLKGLFGVMKTKGNLPDLCVQQFRMECLLFFTLFYYY